MKEEFILQVTEKGLEFGRGLMGMTAYKIHGPCKKCNLEMHEEGEYLCIPFDVDYKEKIIYCVNCGEIIYPFKEYHEIILNMPKKEWKKLFSDEKKQK